MNRIKNSMVQFIPVFVLLFASGCAAGAATAVTAGYAVKADSAERAVVSERSHKADSADSLTSEAEQKIVDRAKREALVEMSSKR